MEWISVNDHLPEKSHVVLMVEDDDIQCGYYSRLSKKWISCQDRLEQVKPTHWMPLPDLPKEDA